MITNLYEMVKDKEGNITFKKFDFLKTTIKGKTIEEILQILNGLDLEHEKEMTLTMNNLSKWCELINDDIKKNQEEAIKKFMASIGE